MSRIIGIDLGTTTSVVTYMKNGKPEVVEDLQDQQGTKIIPSVVSIDDNGKTIAGKQARAQMLARPEYTVMEVKRLFGTDKLVKMGEKEFQPYEISEILLANLKKMAEDYLYEEVSEAVITVPANFNNIQRELTKKAGEMAGLKVERIINEPTAAAIAYGLNNLEKQEKVLVYDLGGGTFDVTILEIIDGVVDVICSRGDNELGGKDFDNQLEKHVINTFYNKYGINLKEQGDVRTLNNLKLEVEETKKKLSTSDSVNIYMPYIAFKDNQPLSIDINISINEFENMILDLVASTSSIIDEALNAAKLTVNDIDTVLLVGGSTRIPLVKEILNDKFPNKIKNNINPDFAVAMGAAIQGEIKLGTKTSEISSLVISDRCSHNLGIAVRKNIDGVIRDDVFSKIIEKDYSIPCTKTKVYTTVGHNQKEVIIPIYEGDGDFIGENTKIGQVVLDSIPPGPAGSQDIVVDFKYDLNGIINVVATIASTGKYINTTIDFGKSIISTSTAITEIDGKIAVIDNAVQSKVNYTKCSLYEKIKSSMEFAQNIADECENLSIKKRIDDTLKSMQTAIVENDEKKLLELDNDLTDIIFEI